MERSVVALVISAERGVGDRGQLFLCSCKLVNVHRAGRRRQGVARGGEPNGNFEAQARRCLCRVC